ncbi:NrdA-like aerobic NDP reductase large subunit [Dickeya phage vB-DsoM-LIMEstone1]|uniref:Ribonucleoside-diphosphate reductase n=3 Tax=Limestonevirus limestone TaxID=1091052 RepID=I0J2U2_9CAUD|nr:NrdA-like aerobic NDP reductase large subunit [Dickeya phage vB-DsoM-LIMEstone1]AIM51323.1 ribonucleoside-diphosphate reductase alpha subunit [Dickeya phage phiD3]QHB42379.1 ribonucleotide reductase of class Ia (aerobic), alpha subunit [Dickeya phage Ds23CZ]CCD57629.1 putative ribonucleoside-diphosphate reductase subunit alpha NrdA [Dickeya phage vB-DsoM-LIMEstone1]
MINVIKRDGSSVPFDIEKLHAVVDRACDGLAGVSMSEVISASKIQFTDNMRTDRIQDILIQAAASLISVDKPNYQYVAARLKSYDLRKAVYGQYKPPHLLDIFVNNIKRRVYDREFLDLYTTEEFNELNDVINHKRDKNFTWAAMGQLTEKYLLRDRSRKDGKVFYETPQVMYMGIAMALFSNWDKDSRLEMVKKFYEYASTGKFSLPTPIMAGVRTPTRQFSSCVLIKTGDTLDSINATAKTIVDYVSKRAGIGFDFGAIRGIGSPIRGGEMVHTGLIPFIKYLTGALKSCSQGGIRGGAATGYIPLWHYQFDDVVVLKNNRGTEENRERRIDYGIQINRVMFERLVAKQPLYLFDPKDNPDMYEAYFADVDKFRVLYENMIKAADAGICRAKKLQAEEVFQMLLDQRSDTGRIYIAFVDHMNQYSPFNLDTIYSSNLCFTGDTMVAAADGRNMVSIKELADWSSYDKKFPVYSARPSKKNDGGWVTEIKMAKAAKTGVREVVEVLLSNGQTFRCTPDHPLALSDARGDYPYVEARHAVGQKLKGFYTTMSENKYRRINSVSNGLSNQHRMIYEFYDGPLDPGNHIDHIVDDAVVLDEIGNLRSIPAEDNFAKKSASMSGVGNPSNPAVKADKARAVHNCSVRTSMERNPKFKGMSNQDILDLAWEMKDNGEMVTLPRMVKKSPSMPNSFSKNRFGGKFSNLTNMLEVGARTIEPFEHKEKLVVSNVSREAPMEDPTVVSITPAGVEDVYDLTVDDNHNFFIVTNDDPMSSEGILVHNCLEIALPTREFQQYDDESGRVALCTLASFNLTAFEDPTEMEDVAFVLVSALDMLLEYQDYPAIQARKAVEDYRPLGIGIVNVAHFLAKNFTGYGSPAGLEMLDAWMAHLHYYLVKASNRLAMKFGACKRGTIHGMGQVTADLQPLPLDILPNGKKPEGMAYGLDWDELKDDLKTYGIRNATLLAVAPTESSSQVLNATNGIEPPKGLVSVKGSKDGAYKQVVPDVETLGPLYDLKWDLECIEYLKTAAVIQRWVDQSISTNTWYDPEKYPDGKIPRAKMMQDILSFYMWGGKTLYYNTNKDAKEDEELKQAEEPGCDSCIV